MRKIGLFVSLLLLALVAAVFAWNNPGTIDVDIAFTRFDDVAVPIAFAFAFAVGWLAGLVSVGAAVLRLADERRRLRRKLRLTEAEVSSLRNLPLQDPE